MLTMRLLEAIGVIPGDAKLPAATVPVDDEEYRMLPAAVAVASGSGIDAALLWLGLSTLAANGVVGSAPR